MHLILDLLASTPIQTPDTGMTGMLLGAGVLALGIFARFLKNRTK